MKNTNTLKLFYSAMSKCVGFPLYLISSVVLTLFGIIMLPILVVLFPLICFIEGREGRDSTFEFYEEIFSIGFWRDSYVNIWEFFMDR